MTCLYGSNTISLVAWHRESMLHNISTVAIIAHLRNTDYRWHAERRAKQATEKGIKLPEFTIKRITNANAM